MLAWRIARAKFALDRSGAGGLADGGRWHAQGVPVIYAGLSVEICTMEKLAHTGHILPPDLMLVALSLPDDMALYETADCAALPGWEATPPGAVSLEYGTTFLRSLRALGLIVPSAIVPEARNIVLNPLHPRFAEVGFELLRPFVFLISNERQPREWSAVGGVLFRRRRSRGAGGASADRSAG